MRPVRLCYLLLLVFAFCPVVAFAHDGDGKDLSNSGRGGSGGGGPFASLNVELLSHLELSQIGSESDTVIANDIWGWQDSQSGRRFAIIGLTNGTSFIEVSDPRNPVYMGKLATHETGQNQAWRDVKVFNDQAFIVADGSGNDQGIQVLGMQQLLALNPAVDGPTNLSETHHYAGLSRAHNIVINENSGLAYAVGAYDTNHARLHGGGLSILDISDAGNITEIGSFAGDGYTHDAQAVTYTGPDSAHVGKEIVFASNEDSLTIVEVSVTNNTATTNMLSRGTYSGSNYSHQGWLTDDQKYFFMNDELDEYNHARGPDGKFGTDDDGDPIPTKTHIWDVQDLDNPTYIGFHEGTEKTIDHNLYVKGDYIYQANYTSGLRILQMIDPANGLLQEVGYFDTYMADNHVSFNGAWSVYPYFDDMLLVSDRQGGLFILQQVPEPSGLLLAGLGLLAAASRRRRRA